MTPTPEQQKARAIVTDWYVGPQDEFPESLVTAFAAALVEARPQRTEGDSYRQGMHHAALLCRNEFKRSPEAARDHDSVYMSGYEDACDHLSIVIEQAAVIDCVPALVEAGGVQWQDIATAPKDKPILGGWYYNSQMWRWGRCEYDDDGWYGISGGTPTHWMPLPSPPEIRKETK